MQISAGIHQNYAKLCKSKPFFSYKPFGLLKKKFWAVFGLLGAKTGHLGQKERVIFGGFGSKKCIETLPLF